MREFKIRVWDVEGNDWFYTVPGNPNDHNVLDTVYFSEVTQDENKYIWEQYIGLKDKNGKEIYEGDVVQDSKGAKCRVEWNIGEAHFGLYVGKQMELTDFIWMRGEDLEIIGNTHEKPELLEGEEPEKAVEDERVNYQSY